jgi:hypothetical protein
VHFILKYSKIKIAPVNKKLTTTFKNNIKNSYVEWWRSKMQPDNSTKYDFFYKYKKNYIFEKYLDEIPRHIRLYVTRLRTSSHNLPVEIMRYTKPKTLRENRKCKICNLDKVGDEAHYLLDCSNTSLLEIRTEFLAKIRSNFAQLENFNKENIIDYGMIMNDSSLQEPMALFVKEILCKFKDETLDIKSKMPTFTRSGRQVKKPTKLNL